MKNSSNPQFQRAFSLIELSIVILIIGIIIAGVTQSSRMVKAFKLTTARTITQSSPVPSIKDLVFWIDATSDKSFLNQNNSADIQEGDTIQSWIESNPISLNKRSFIQNTVSYQPLYTENGINGLPAVKFDAANDNSRLVGPIDGGVNLENTLFMVMRWEAVNATLDVSQVFVILGGTLSTEYGLAADGSANIYNYDGNVEDSLDFNIEKNTGIIVERVYNPSTNISSLYINGVLISTTTASLSGIYNASAPTSVTIGNHTSAPRTFGGELGEMIFYEHALRTEERKSVEAYLSKKWGIKIN